MASNVAIVAIPEEDEYVWRISSEKKPHMTLLFLGDVNDPDALSQISQYVEHVASTTVRRFGMSVDRRGELGDEKADVLFFEKDWPSAKRLEEVRENLLKNDAIKTAYDSATQFPSWIPHLTLGFPDAPAKKDLREYPKFHWIEFDKLALWIDDFEGPEFVLEKEDDLVMSGQSRAQSILSHYGVKGMKWGVRNDRRGRSGSTKRTTFRRAPSKLSNSQLSSRIKRMESERKYNQLNRRDVSRGEQMVRDILANSGQRIATTVLTGASLAVIRTLVSSKFGEDVGAAVTRRLK